VTGDEEKGAEREGGNNIEDGQSRRLPLIKTTRQVKPKQKNGIVYILCSSGGGAPFAAIKKTVNAIRSVR
jgi:hypothetical protein